MSFYRSMIAACAAILLATPVFADEASNATQKPAADNYEAVQLADNQSMQSTDQQTTSTDQKVDLNKATTKDLMKVKGLSSSKAKAIVAYRKKHGDFKSLDDLSNVKGFKKMSTENLKAIQDQLLLQ